MKNTYSTLLILLLFTFVTNYNLYAQGSPEELIDKFFKEFTETGPGEAVRNLYATNPWMTRSQDAINNVVTKIDSYNEELVGPYYGNELITKKSINERFVLYSYFVRYDRQPFRFTFQFYKPNTEWRIYSFQFDDKLDDELEESAKLYLKDY